VSIVMMGCSQQPIMNEIDRSIAEIRKGELTVQANKGEQITIEQLQLMALRNHPYSVSPVIFSRCTVGYYCVWT